MMEPTIDCKSPLQMDMPCQSLSPPPRKPMTITASSTAGRGIHLDSTSFPPFPFNHTAQSWNERYILKPRALEYNRSPFVSPFYHATMESPSPMLVDDDEEFRHDDGTSLDMNKRNSKALDMNDDAQLLQVLGRVDNLLRGESGSVHSPVVKRRNSQSAPSA